MQECEYLNEAIRCEAWEGNEENIGTIIKKLCNWAERILW